MMIFLSVLISSNYLKFRHFHAFLIEITSASISCVILLFPERQNSGNEKQQRRQRRDNERGYIFYNFLFSQSSIVVYQFLESNFQLNDFNSFFFSWKEIETV